MNMEVREQLQLDGQIYSKLLEAEREADFTDQRYTSKEVLNAMREAIRL